MTKAEKTESVTALYDLGYHLVDSIPEDELGSSVAKIKGFIKDGGGSIVFERDPRHMNLAYPISRSRKGARDIFTSSYFGTIVFETSKDSIGAIEKALAESTSVLRSMLIETNRARAEETIKNKADDKEREKKAAEAAAEEVLDKTLEALTT